jgi:hypothetical protein
MYREWFIYPERPHAFPELLQARIGAGAMKLRDDAKRALPIDKCALAVDVHDRSHARSLRNSWVLPIHSRLTRASHWRNEPRGIVQVM